MSVQTASIPSPPRLEPDTFRASAAEWDDWRWHYANRFTRERDLERIPWLGTREKDGISRVMRIFPWAVTPYFLSLIQWEDPQDPVRKQVLPDPAELRDAKACSMDPLAEQAHTVAPGLIHRYPDRVVLLATPCCAVFCRHCFRKRLWEHNPFEEDSGRWKKVLSYLSSHEEIRDVLISGGDPLTLPDSRLDEILGRLRGVPHIEIIRIGTRIPVVLPQRITAGLCRVLDKHGPVWLVTQFNHTREITEASAGACERLLRCGVPVNNQSVLLRGVNDDPEIVKTLCHSLVRIRVRPYYLHQCDRVAGAEHFRTPVEKGIQIMDYLQGRTSGLAVPKFMVDLPGRGGKVPVQPNYLVSREKGKMALRSYTGEIFSYENPSDNEMPALPGKAGYNG